MNDSDYGKHGEYSRSKIARMLEEERINKLVKKAEEHWDDEKFDIFPKNNRRTDDITQDNKFEKQVKQAIKELNKLTPKPIMKLSFLTTFAVNSYESVPRKMLIYVTKTKDLKGLVRDTNKIIGKYKLRIKYIGGKHKEYQIFHLSG